MIKKIIFASDYQGIELREKLVKTTTQGGYFCQDIGIPVGSKIDYIDISKYLAEEIYLNADAIGIMVCGSGQGVAMVLNRFTHIRAGVCRTLGDAVQIREKLDANVLCLGSKQNTFSESMEIVKNFIKTPFISGKYSEYVMKLKSSPTHHGEKIHIIVRAIIIQNDHILCTTATHENPYFPPDIYFLPGGHVDYNESCLSALKRELYEESALNIESAEFSGAIECSWNRQGMIYHEINIIYQTKIKKLNIFKPPISTEIYQKFVWIPLNQIAKINILPVKLKEVITEVITFGKNKFYSEMSILRTHF